MRLTPGARVPFVTSPMRVAPVGFLAEAVRKTLHQGDREAGHVAVFRI